MILDADILIDILRGLPAADNWVTTQTVQVVVSGIAAIELVYGARDATGLRQARELLSTFVIEWPTSDDVQNAVSMAALHLSCGIDGPDAITAAIAVRIGSPIATFNVKHFRAIPGVTTIQPYQR